MVSVAARDSISTLKGGAKGSVESSRELSDVVLRRAVRQLDCMEVDHCDGEVCIGGMARPTILRRPEKVV